MSDPMQYAFRALAQRALTEHELRTRLARRGVDEAESERVIARLREYGYLNDASVARATSEKRGVGARRVKHELTRRGVDPATVDEVIAGRDPDSEREDAARLVDRHRERWLRARDPRARAFGFLARRGYPPNVIWDVLGDLGRGDDGPGEPDGA